MSTLGQLRGLSLYKALSSIPVYTEARYIPSNGQFSSYEITLSAVDHYRNQKRSFRKTLLLNEGRSVFSSEPQEVLSEVVLRKFAPSGNRHAVLREVPNEDGGGKKRFVEVWSSNRIEVVKEVTKLHGEFYTDELFASLSFSPSETSLVWCAEKAKASERKDSNASKDNDDKSDDPATFRHVPDYGERYKGRLKPSLFLLRWNRSTGTSTSHKLSVSNNPEYDTVGLGEACFGIDDNTIFATGYEGLANGQRLGVAGCTNRPTGIHKLTLNVGATLESDLPETIEVEAKMISDPELSSFSPRVIAGTGILVTPRLLWLSNAMGGAHFSCSQLYVQPLHKGDNDPSNSKVLVDIVENPTSPDDFPGIYTFQLPENPLVSPTQIAINTIWRSGKAVAIVDLENGQVQGIVPQSDSQEDAPASLVLLAADRQGSMLFSESSLICPPRLLLGRMSFIGKSKVLLPHLEWSEVDAAFVPPSVSDALSTLQSSLIPIPADGKDVETLLIKHADDEQQDCKRPCVTVIHGGPHITSLAEFTPSYVALALEGYTISLPNYTGSAGFGQASITDLLGKCGTMDVEQCYASIQELVRRNIAEEGKGKQFVMGGSHGGFLSLHLIARYPDFFTAAIVRNPVTYVPSLIHTSDIPDWGYEELGLRYQPNSTIDHDNIAAFHNASPLTYAYKIETPVLFLLGEDDLRVPHSQGKSMCRYLKGRKVEVDMLVFPKNGHALDKVEASRVGWKAGVDWLGKFATSDVHLAVPTAI